MSRKNLIWALTVDGLYSQSVIIWQLVPLRVHIFVDGKHQSCLDLRVGQSQCMPKLMGCHQEQVGSCTYTLIVTVDS